MTPLVSILLDWTRFALALVVAGGHLTHPALQQGWPDQRRFGLVAVGGFFLLSGFTIRYVTRDMRDARGAARFFGDRAARLLSVSAPSLIFTVLCDGVALVAAHDYYVAHWGDRWDDPLLRFAANAVLYSQPYGLDIEPFSNSPFWSLSYEAGFYVLWGLVLYARMVPGKFWLLVPAALLYGPNIVFMLPFWLLGVLLFDQIERLTTPADTRRFVARMLIAAVVGGIVVARYHTHVVSGAHGMIDVVFDGIGVPRGRVAVSYMAGSVLLYVGFGLALPLLRTLEDRVRAPARLVAASRLLGEATFPLYCIHFPFYVAVTGLRLVDGGSSAQKLLLLGATVGLALLAVRPTNRLKQALRTRFRRALSAA